MITYVNNVFVSNNNANVTKVAPVAVQSMSSVSSQKGDFIFMNCDPDIAQDKLYEIDANTQRIKIGMIQGKNAVVRKADGSVEYRPLIKWSNEIKKNDIKSFRKLTCPANPDTEDKIFIELSQVVPSVQNILKEGYKRVIVKLTFKDLPTRYRKWTESYEYVTAENDTLSDIATGIANEINGQWKRARVQATVGTYTPASGNTPASFSASANGTAIQIEALPYDDDNAVDTLNWANKVRFNASMWFTDPQAPGFASKNKYALKGAVIEKEPGKRYAADAKLVRDREAQALGYEGILNRGEGTWPIIKPAMETDINAQYDALTLEFENMYRAADDIFRKTKQTVEIYVPTGKLATIESELTKFAGAPVDEGIA